MQSNEVTVSGAPPSGRSASISVVIPCYRCLASIDRALSSVAAQTLQPLEILLVDDASNDGTLEHIRGLERLDETGRIRVIPLRQNAGPAGARNRGWDLAKGEFIAFLDADDSWHPRKLELQWNYLREHPQTVLSGHAIARGSNGPSPVVGSLIARQISAHRLLFSNPIAPTSAMLRRELPLRFREGHRHMEDHLLWMNIAFQGHTVACINLPLAYQYKAPFGEGGLSAQLWLMEKADLNNYLLLQQSEKLGAQWLLLLWPWSFLKFLRRLLITAFSSLSAKNQ